ncbi:MAG: alpha-galactosidase [Opitutaceae bacterium]|nr:alpha-galactosidase [Opitutaceae bacterium]
MPLARFAFACLAMALSAAAAASSDPLVLTHDGLHIAVDRATGRWTARWPSGAEVSQASFGAEIDGKGWVMTTPQLQEKRTFSESLGAGEELRHVWRQGAVRIEREIRLYAGGGRMTVSGRVVNEGAIPVRVGTVHLVQAEQWRIGSTERAPAALSGSNLSQTAVLPAAPGAVSPGIEQAYSGSGVISFFNRDPDAALTLGYVRADGASPDLAARYITGRGGVELRATSRYLDRELPAGATLELNRLSLDGAGTAFVQLESLGDALALAAPRPARTGPIALWCSWYAHRLEVSEDKVLANAAVAARHFGPLGFSVMQVDHGWQRRDITGDWTANERFPHGLKWLANQLRERHGLKLGLWISPTDVASTSELYARHPEWMLKGEDGKAKVNWRWYWKPNPDCYQLDVSQPAAYEHVASMFRSLVAEDVSYFKIDFISGQAKEIFFPADPTVTRGWGEFRRAMEAVRAGAGDAWVRYCQGPPLLSVGLADGAYGGDDTADAGQPGMFRVLKDNARILATSFWLNQRAYQREVCDMSMRMQASVEEARVRGAIMALAGASISWSDELTYLPASRIRMMQQCLPAGAPAMRPVDLFERVVPSLWHLKPTTAVEQWDVVGVFNFDEQPAVRSVRFDRLGLDLQAEYAVFEFWQEKYLGTVRGGLDLELPPESSRILSIRRITGRPQLIGTDMHVFQGYHELKAMQWDESTLRLSGRYERMPGLSQRAYFLIPTGYSPKFEFPLSPGSARLTHVQGNLWMQEVDFVNRAVSWALPFEKAPPAPVKKEPNAP